MPVGSGNCNLPLVPKVECEMGEFQKQEYCITKFLRSDHNVKIKREKKNKLDSTMIKKLVFSHDITKTVKRQSTKWKKKISRLSFFGGGGVLFLFILFLHITSQMQFSLPPPPRPSPYLSYIYSSHFFLQKRSVRPPRDINRT